MDDEDFQGCLRCKCASCTCIKLEDLVSNAIAKIEAMSSAELEAELVVAGFELKDKGGLYEN